MPKYRVFYLKDELSRRFQELPPLSIRSQLKPKDYTLVAEIEAANEYAAWQALRAEAAEGAGAKLPRRFAVGDVLEREEGKPRLCLFGGFEDATWWAPEAPPPPAPETVETSPPASLNDGGAEDTKETRRSEMA